MVRYRARVRPIGGSSSSTRGHPRRWHGCRGRSKERTANRRQRTESETRHGWLRETRRSRHDPLTLRFSESRWLVCCLRQAQQGGPSGHVGESEKPSFKTEHAENQCVARLVHLYTPDAHVWLPLQSTGQRDRVESLLELFDTVYRSHNVSSWIDQYHGAAWPVWRSLSVSVRFGGSLMSIGARRSSRRNPCMSSSIPAPR